MATAATAVPAGSKEFAAFFRRSRLVLRATVLLVAAIAIISALRPSNRYDLGPMIHSPAIALELAGDARTVRLVLGNGETRRALAGYLWADFLLIFSYALYFIATAKFVRISGPALAQKIARLVVVLTVLTALLDVTENFAALWLMNRFDAAGAAEPVFLRAASRWKWWSLGATLAGLGLLWIMRWRWQNRTRIAALAIGGAYIASSILCVTGTVRPGLLEKFAVPLSAAVLLQTLILMRRLGLTLRMLYLIRMPLLALILLAIFGPIAVGPGRQMLLGLMDLGDYPLAVSGVTFMAVLAASSALAQINLVLLYAHQRTGDPALAGLKRRRAGRLGTFLAGMAAAGVLIGAVCYLSDELHWWQKAFAVMIGFAAAGAVVFTAKCLQLWFTDRSFMEKPPYLIFPAALIPPLDEFFNGIYRSNPPWWVQKIKNLFRGLKQRAYSKLGTAARGFFAPTKPHRLLPAHVFALSLALLSLAVYVVVGMGKAALTAQAPPFNMPSLAYVLLALSVASWGFSTLAFFLDRYRVPVLISFVLLCCITGLSPSSDHVFLVREEPRPFLNTPAFVLSHKPYPILVAAAGGGIQASAWTAAVLSGLDPHRARNINDPYFRTPFRANLALMSGVSGGSVGLMMFGAHFSQSEVGARHALVSSLDEVAWGWVQPDLWRTVVPSLIPRHVDRGFALEQTWRVREGLSDVYLSTWARRAGPEFPAFLLNATIAEQGKPMAFATTAFASEKQPVVESFHGIYGVTRDLHVTTAARLSASFPYVAPAARPDGDDLEHPDWHFVDGGYYDNFGLLALMQWTNEALNALPLDKRPKKMQILIVRAFPDEDSKRASTGGWLSQAMHPVKAFLSVRSEAQWHGARKQLDLFRSDWNRQGVEIDVVDFQYEKVDSDSRCDVPPLSWKLTREEQDCIRAGWGQFAARHAGRIARVSRFAATGRFSEP